jgi:hypothetical protein
LKKAAAKLNGKSFFSKQFTGMIAKEKKVTKDFYQIKK